MDSLIVDLDKVLDDFEAEETTNKTVGNVSSEYANFLAKNDDHSWEEACSAPADSVNNIKTYNKDDLLSYIDYGEPYEPVSSNFDLSEADFAPSIKTNPELGVSNGISNGHDESLSNDHEQFNFDHRRSGKIPQTTDVAINGFKENVSENFPMHNGNKDHMIDLQNTSVAKAEFVGKSSQFNEEKRPIQVVDIFTPVSEDAPQVPTPTTYLRSLMPVKHDDLNLHENINVKFNEGVPEQSNAEGGFNSEDADNKEDGRCHGIDGNSYFTNKSSTNSSYDTFIKNDLSNGNEISSLKKVNNVPSKSSNRPINHDPPNIAHGGDNKKVDEGYDSYDCLSRDNVVDGLQIKKEDNSPTPSLNLSDVISERHSLNEESIQASPKSEGKGESAPASLKTEQQDSFDQTALKTIDCESDATVKEATKHTVTASDKHEVGGFGEEYEGTTTDRHEVVGFGQVLEGNTTDRHEVVGFGQDLQGATTDKHEVVGFGLELQVNDEDLDNYLRDIEGLSNSQDMDLSNSMLIDSDANIYPPCYSNIDQLSNENHKHECKKEGTSDLQDSSQTLNVDMQPNLKTEQNEQLPNQTTSSNEYIVKDQNCESIQPSASDLSPVESLTVQNMQLPSVEMGGARPKDANWHASKQGLSVISNELPKDLDEIKHFVDLGEEQENINSDVSNTEGYNSISENQVMENVQCEKADVSDSPVMRRFVPSESPSDMSRPHSWGPSGSDTLPIPQQKRPNSLNLPQRGELNGSGERSQQPFTFPYPANEEDETISPEVQEEAVQSEEVQAVGGEPVDDASGASGHTPSPDLSSSEPQPNVDTALGKSAPKWIPDSDAPVCMSCEAKFTFTKRRHHCRACGKVFCSSCCNLKSRLLYMENKEARVCIECHRQLTIAELSSSGSPNPNNPSEYCSVIPPSQQASARSQPPSVLVPASVLKREGSNRHSSEGKHVMFSDGIRPGGDLTELDGSDSATRLPLRRSGRSQRKVEKSGSPETAHRQVARKLRASEARRHICLIPETGLPPVIKPTGEKGGYVMEESRELEKVMTQIRDDETEPVIFALNANLFVLVKIINLDCCVNRICWCFTTRGMCNVGQDEIVFVLEVIPDEENIPLDIMRHFYTVYEEAGKGNTVTHMRHTIFNQTFLDSRDHGGILYIRPTFQCLHKLLLPNPPYVFGILLQKWETPWAKVFPLRLLLRLGAEYRYYPCPLISVRNRKPVFFEIGHTIMNLLADFRNFQYMLPQIKGVTIHMEDKKTAITFPRNRYEDIMKVVSNSNEHVMALGASFSLQADSHLVCIQNDDGNYQTQAINIQNKPRKVTGASFVVFNGALKTSSGLKAKSSIVEDGLMVQITPESMVALKQALKDMTDFTIECGSQTAPNPDEVVSLMWGDDDKNINIGVKSPIDDMSMDGVESIHIPNATDYVGEKQIIRWTDVFFIQNKDSGSTRWEPVDLSRLAETLSNATCIALTPHLDKLKEASLIKIGLRVNIEIEKVGYEIGSNGERLPDLYMNDLDNELIPVIHSAASQNRGGAIILELIFHVLD